MSDFQETDDYSEFDPAAYHDTMFGSVDGPEGQHQMRVFVVDTLSDIYDTGKIHGDSLLDFGTGPVVYNIISATSHFSNIFLSDISQTNRDALWRWLTDDHQALDHSCFFQHVCQRRNSKDAWSSLEDDMRNKVKGILYCDMTQQNPLHPSIFPQFDCVSSGLCLEVAPGTTISAYESAAKNVSSLIKPGGWLILNGTLSCKSYSFGKSRYNVVSLTADDIKRTWTGLGYTIDTWKQYDMDESEKAVNNQSDCEGMFCMAAKKEVKC